MTRISSPILIGISLVLASSLSMAENIPEDDFVQMCKACESCCSSYDNVEVIESVSDARKKRASNKKKSIRKKSTAEKANRLKEKEVSKTNAWLKAPLFASTISGAALSPATSYSTDGQFRVVINSLFSLDCVLNFNHQGQPSRLSQCKPKSKGSSWKVKEKNIILDCSDDSGTSSVCTGSYTLAFSDNEDQNETHKITLSKRN